MSLPPLYSSYASTSGSSSSSGSRKSPDKDRKISLRKHHTDTSHDPEKDTADLRSIASGHSGSSTRTHLSSRSDTLKLAIRTDVADKKHTKVIRRARCSPEFLEEIAKAGVPHGFKTRAESTFRVISGLEAEALFEQFIGGIDHSANEKALREYARQNLSRPVVFAFSLIHAGRRVVDYYMTWRGKIPRVRDRRDHRRSFLDSEFRRVAKSLDQHYRSILSVVDNSTPISEPARLPDASKRSEEPSNPPVQEEPPRSPDAVSATASVVSLPLLNMIRNVPFGNRQTLRVTNPDTASILSDASADGRETPVPSAPRILETIAEAVEAATAASLAESPISVPEPSQPGQADVGKSPKSRHRSSSIKEHRKSHSEGSRTTPDREKKSPGAGDDRRHSSHRHGERKKSPGAGDDQRHSSHRHEERKKSPGAGDERRHSSHRHEEHKHRSEDAEKKSPGTGDERKHSSHRHEEHKHRSEDAEKKSPGTGDERKHSSHRHEEHKHQSEDDSEKKSPGSRDERRHSSHRHRHEEHKHRSEDDSHKRSTKRHHHDTDKDRNEESDSDVASEFTIVLLDDLAEKDLLSWHGLNRTDVNATPRSVIPVNDSPWTGPLVNANKIIFHTQSRHGQVDEPPFTDDDESDESDDDYEYQWQDNSPVIPHIFTEGPRHFASPAPPIVPLSFARPSAPSYSPANSATPLARSTSLRPTSAASYRTAYIYPVHGVHQSPSASSYVPAWIDPRHYDTPLTMVQTPLSYPTASPF